MKKITTLAVILLLGAAVITPQQANAQKFGYVEFQELIQSMPEYKKSSGEMEAYGKQLQEEMRRMNTELESKYADYEKAKATMNATVREYKEKEIRDMQTRLQEFQEHAQEEVRKKEAELLKPIIEKAKTAISDVAKARGVTYVFDSSPGTPLLYKPDGDNLMEDVKKKLGITTGAATPAPTK